MYIVKCHSGKNQYNVSRLGRGVLETISSRCWSQLL